MSVTTSYEVSGKVPASFKDSACGLDLTFDVFFKLELTVSFPDEIVQATVNSGSKIQKAAVDETKLAYMIYYGDSVPMTEIDAGKPRREFVSYVASRLSENIKTSYSAVLEAFDITGHGISETDRAKWNSFQEQSRRLDPKYACGQLLKEQGISGEQMQAQGSVIPESIYTLTGPNPEPKKPDPLRNSWVCECGRINDRAFCRDCGRKRNMAKWVCVCGKTNTSKFCPECGNPRGE